METPGAAPDATGSEPERPTTSEAQLDPSGVPSLDEDLDEAETDTAAAGAQAAAAVAESETFIQVGRFKLGRPGLPRSRRGLFALLLLLGGIGSAVAFSGVILIQWTETADFCGRCHQMEPELAAYEAGPHRDVACGECHVAPGIGGWVKSKINGTKQLVQVITGLYPKPIPPADHEALPSVDDTCKRCHSPDRFALQSLSMRQAYVEDEPNTPQALALMIRPGGGDPYNVERSVHWHILRDVEYWSSEPNGQKIDLVEVVQTDGTIEQFVAQDQIATVEDVEPEIATIKADIDSRRMDCLDCHNRVGHPIPNPRKGTDASITSGLIDRSLPYIKRESMDVLRAVYPSVEVADQAAAQIAGFYELHYPDVYTTQRTAIDRAISQVKVLYRLTATPAMKVTFASYPDNMGHQDFPGCFRCHDGGHFLVVDGAITKETIPSTCDTCHTFPQIGGDVATLPLGEPPSTHNDSLWVFNHKSATTSTDPGGTACGTCHAQDYCVSCHNTGAIDVSHDEMLVNHAQVIRDAPNGAESCTYCHQPVYCARCHNEPVMPATGPFAATGGGTTGALPAGGTGGPGSLVHPIASPPGVEYPLSAAVRASAPATTP